MSLDDLLFSDGFRWGFFALVIAGAWAGWTRRVRWATNTLRLMGTRLEGARVQGSRWSVAYPSLSFRHQGCPVTVSLSEGGGKFPAETRFEVTLPRPLPFRLQLWREGPLEKLGKATGVQDLTVGDPAFDRAFLVRGDDPGAARGLLGDELRRALVWFRKLQPWLTVRGRQVEVKIHALPDDRGEFERFFALGRLAADAALDALG
ncbi:MAG TPA: hypothetical protein VK997_06905 [Deferrisomatales bacterium]|nr:hypothetical protein [Deferrisomatales bacterium]